MKNASPLMSKKLRNTVLVGNTFAAESEIFVLNGQYRNKKKYF